MEVPPALQCKPSEAPQALRSLAAEHAKALELLAAQLEGRGAAEPADGKGWEPARRPSTPVALCKGPSLASLESASSFRKGDHPTLGAAGSKLSQWPANLLPRANPETIHRSSSSSTPAISVRVTKSMALHSALGNDSWFCLSFRKRKLIIPPHSSLRIGMDLLSVLLLGLDFVTLPYILAWNDIYGDAATSVGVAIACFWTFDMLMSSVTTFYVDEETLEQRLPHIVKRYIMTAFPMDGLLVSLDWAALLLLSVSAEDSSSFQWSRFARFAKALRFVRLLGMVRVLRVRQRVEDVIGFAFLTDSALLRMTILLCKVMLPLLWLVHVFSCIWFGVGLEPSSDTGVTWISSSTLDEAGDNILFQYLSSFHWTLTGLLAGSSEFLPKSSSELVIAIMVQLCGLAVNCTAVALLSSSVTEMTLQQQQTTMEMGLIRRFLRERGITKTLGMQVVSSVNRRWCQTAPVALQKVPALQELPRSLLSDLLVEICWPTLMQHGLFRVWHSVDDKTVQSLCLEACQHRFAQKKQELFCQGADMSTSLVLVAGSATYSQSCSLALHIDEDVEEQAGTGSWFCEGALWSHWTTVGRAVVNTASVQLIAVDAEKVWKVGRQHWKVNPLTETYGHVFHNCIVQNQGPPFEQWPSDLRVPGTSFEELVLSMGSEEQELVGHSALESLAAHHRFRSSNKNALRILLAELESKESVLVESLPGKVVRVVSVLAAEVRAADGLVLLSLAKVPLEEHSEGKAICRLPGVRQLAGERLQDAESRLFKTLGPLATQLSMISVDQERDSSAWSDRVSNLYVRTKLLAAVDDHNQLGLSKLSAAGLCRSEGHEDPDSPMLNMDIEIWSYTDSTSRHFIAWLNEEELQRWNSTAGRKTVHAYLPSMMQANLVTDTSYAADVSSDGEAQVLSHAVSCVAQAQVLSHAVSWLEQLPDIPDYVEPVTPRAVAMWSPESSSSAGAVDRL